MLQFLIEVIGTDGASSIGSSISEVICGGGHALRSVKFVLGILSFLLTIVPIILIVFIAIDFVRGIMAGNVSDMKKYAVLAIKRVIMCLLLFLVEPIVNVTIDVLGSNGVNFAECVQIARDNDDFSEYDVDTTTNSANISSDLTSRSRNSIVPGSSGSSGGSQTGILKAADKVWKKIYNDGFVYGASGNVPAVGNTVDCSGFVSWVICEYGYDDFCGPQHSTVTFLSESSGYGSKYGWTVIDVASGEDVSSKLQPGDILVRDSGAGGYDGHANIFVKNEDGNIYVYDAGSTGNWSGSSGEAIVNSSFAKGDYRSGVIIRVTPPKSK